jgi:hypothetical protein
VLERVPVRNYEAIAFHKPHGPLFAALGI